MNSFEKLKSQRALSNAIEKIYGIKTERKLSLLLQYNYSSVKQLETLLSREGLKLVPNKIDENKVDILKNGVKQKTLKKGDFNFKEENLQRKKQLKAIFHKYKDKYSNQVFRVIDDRERNGRADETVNEKAEIKVEFESELQHNFKKLFGVDIVFHNKDDKDPFGYTIIDHKTGSVFKGSEIMKMKDLFEFTNERIDKKTFEKLKAFNVSNEKEKKCLKEHFKRLGIDVKDFMVFENRSRKTLKDYKALKKDVIDFIKSKGMNENVSIVKSDEGQYYAIHSKYHHIQELQSLVGEKMYENLLNPPMQGTNENKGKEHFNRGGNEIDKLLRAIARTEYTKTDPAEKELKKKRKKKKR